MRLCSTSPTRAGRYWAAQARLNAHRRHVVWLASRSPAGYLMLTFEQARMTRAGAAGVVGNFQQESGLNPAEGGSSGLGLGQWNGARVTALYTFAASHHEQALSLEAQAGFTIYELEGSYGSTLAYLRSATDPQAAAVMFEEAYERAGLPNNQAREAYALAAYNHGP